MDKWFERLRVAVLASLGLVGSLCAASTQGAAQEPPRTLSASPPSAAHSAFAAAVDTYLDRFASFHPSIAAGNGLHGHDGQLEDYSPAAIRDEVSWLRQSRRVFESLPIASLTPEERVDRRIVLGLIDGWLLDIDTVRTWQRNPMVYVAAVSDGLHDLATMESAPAALRMQNAIRKMRGVPRLLAQARSNVSHPPKVFVERSIAMLGGVSELLTHDLALAFADAPDAALRRELLQAAQVANRSVEQHQRFLEAALPTSPADGYAIGTANVEARYRAEELIDLPATRLLEIGERELARNQAVFAAAARQVDSTRTPVEVWKMVEADHPARGELVPAARAQVAELSRFVTARHLMTLPTGETVEVAAAPAYDIGLASMHSSPPLEKRPVKSYYYITDAQPEWSEAQQTAWLERFNYPTLADVTAHEVMPGHYVHSLFMRSTTGKLRKTWIGLNPFPQPSSGQDGWAHYAEQMVVDEGFHADDPRYRLAQTAEALTRICRLIAGIRLHSGEWTVEDATALFRQQAHLGEAAARREAVRGTYDPTYGVYFLGKLAALKLRQDYQRAQGADFRLATFHERVMTNGIAPWWAHRQLLLPGDTGAVLE